MVGAPPARRQLIESLEALSRLAEREALDGNELVRAKGRLLRAAPVADVRPVGPTRRGRTLALAVEVLRGADGRARPGMARWLENAVERIDVAIVGAGPDGADAAWRAWLREAGVSARCAERVRFVAHKPPADVYLDPRAARFEGTFPDVAAVRAMMKVRQ